MVLTIKDVAQRWGVTRQTVEKEIKKGRLKAFVVGSRRSPKYRIRLEWVEEFEESNLKT